MPPSKLTRLPARVRNAVVAALVVAGVMLSEVLASWPSRFVEDTLFTTPVRGLSPVARKLGAWLLARRIREMEWDMKVLQARRQKQAGTPANEPPAAPTPVAP